MGTFEQSRKLACFLLLLTLLPAAVSADVKASSPVQLLAKAGTQEAEGSETAAGKGQADSFVQGAGFAYSSGSTWSDSWQDLSAAYYKVKMTDASGRTVDYDTIEPDITYDDDWKVKRKSFNWRTELVTGFYQYQRTRVDEAGNETVVSVETIYFIDGVSLLLESGERRASATYSKYGVHEFKWEPIADYGQMKVLSSRYRIRITDDNADAKEDFASSVIVDTYTTTPDYEIARKDLPVGSYTVKVWCYQRGGGAEEPYILHLTIRNPWAKYDYNLKEDLNITPGEAITRQHASGSKDMTLYGTVNLTTDDAPMTKLRLGGETLEVTCGGGEINALISGDCLTLRSAGGNWRLTQKALHTLRDSGIRTLRLMMPDGSIRELDTDLQLTGRRYALLRARGLVSKDFVLSPAAEAGNWLVEADGERYDLTEKELVLRTEAEEAAG
ncbi:MAG: hypothetical protein IJ573_02260 [Clostridia bacterium]|nr:hypothetical protein [Clostridia bacterium]